nr:leucine zipper protein 2-like isoform X2 [Taeniopygia guttata]
MHAEESKKIQAQLKELHYGRKDLIFKAQQLTDLEQKLSVAKDKLENAALDKESQLKALKETVQLCLCSVLRSQPPAASLISSKPAEKLPSSNAKGSQAPSQGTSTKLSEYSQGKWKKVPGISFSVCNTPSQHTHTTQNIFFLQVLVAQSLSSVH